MTPDAQVEYVVVRSFSDGDGRMVAGYVPSQERMRSWPNFAVLVSGEYLVPRGHPLLASMPTAKPVSEAEGIENEIAAIEAMKAGRREKLTGIKGA